jgi:hypothetical protein
MEWKHWDCLPFKEREHLPSDSGIYVVVDANDNVWYVGQATNLNSRWTGKSHHRYPQLIRSNAKRQYRIYWHPFPQIELNQLESRYITQFCPVLNQTRVKQYSPGKPQLKIEVKRGDVIDYVFTRGSADLYEGISQYLGVYPCTAEDETAVPLQQKQVLRQYALVLAVKYLILIGSKQKTVKILCAAHQFGHAYNNLQGVAYRGGLILEVWQPRRLRYQ